MKEELLRLKTYEKIVENLLYDIQCDIEKVEKELREFDKIEEVTL